MSNEHEEAVYELLYEINKKLGKLLEIAESRQPVFPSPMSWRQVLSVMGRDGANGASSRLYKGLTSKSSWSIDDPASAEEAERLPGCGPTTGLAVRRILAGELT